MFSSACTCNNLHFTASTFGVFRALECARECFQWHFILVSGNSSSSESDGSFDAEEFQRAVQDLSFELLGKNPNYNPPRRILCSDMLLTLLNFNGSLNISDMQDTLPPMDPVFPAPESKLPHSKPKCGSFSKATKRALSQLFKNSKEMI